MYEQLVAFLVGFVAIGSSIMGLIFYGQKKGEAKKENEQNNKVLDNVKIKAEVSGEVNSYSDSERVDKLLEP